MPIFSKSDTSRLDWQLMESSSVTKFFQKKILQDSISWLKSYNYKIIELDYTSYNSSEGVLVALVKELSLSDLFQGKSLDALDDLLYEIDIPHESGLVIVIYQYDLFVKTQPEKAWSVLDILDRHSRRNMLYGLRLLTLIQSTDPTLLIGAVGGQTVGWNHSEWSDHQRGLVDDPFSDIESWLQ